jgi:hypothetical protein
VTWTPCARREPSQLHPRGLREAGGDDCPLERRGRVAPARLGLGHYRTPPRGSRPQRTRVPVAMHVRRWTGRGHAADELESG